MKTNKIDKNIKEKLENRTFKPSASAWERLSIQLDEQPKQKKFGWFFYMGAAASILLLVTIGLQVFSEDSQSTEPKNDIVISPIDKKVIDVKIDELINEVPIPEAIVMTEELETKKEIKHAITSVTKRTKLIEKKNFNKENNKINGSIAKADEKFKNQNSPKKPVKQNLISTIKVNANDLLYAVTHTSEEVKAYYAKYDVSREDVLKAIKGELKKSNLKVNPNTILAEVERSIDDDYFENSFIKSLKRRVSDIAVAIASRND